MPGNNFAFMFKLQQHFQRLLQLVKIGITMQLHNVNVFMLTINPNMTTIHCRFITNECRPMEKR